LGQGNVEGSYFLRFSGDLNGSDSKRFFDDSHDLGLDNNDVYTRFYHGELTFKNVIPNTNIVAGRQYVNHIETLQIDGLDVSYEINDKLSIFGFSGAAVNYYDDWDDDWIHGGGFEFKPFHTTKIRGEYIRANVEDFHDDIAHIRVGPGSSLWNSICTVWQFR